MSVDFPYVRRYNAATKEYENHKVFMNKDEAIAWMQNAGQRTRNEDGTNCDTPDILRTAPGESWVQIGYVLLPHVDWMERRAR